MADQSASAGVAFTNLGPASDYNVFVLGDAQMQWTDAQGRVAVGGNANFNGYTIASGMPSSSAIANLVVGGNYVNNSTTLNGPVFVGGNANINNPTINGNLTVNGNLTLTASGSINNGILTHGGALSQGSVTFNNVLNVSAVSPSPIDFAAARDYLTAESEYLATLAATGTTVVQWGGITLTSGGSDLLQVFNLDGASLSSANHLQINAAAGQTVVVNVSGAIDNFRYFGIDITGTDKQHVLYNFVDATSLTIAGISIQGSILAPLANVNFSNGNIEGTLIAGSLTGSGESHNYSFHGTIPSPPGEDPPIVVVQTPEPSGFVLAGIGAVGLIVASRRRKGFVAN
jgi:choice-of-anchor A domain-containing protein